MEACQEINSNKDNQQVYGARAWLFVNHESFISYFILNDVIFSYMFILVTMTLILLYCMLQSYRAFSKTIFEGCMLFDTKGSNSKRLSYKQSKSWSQSGCKK